MTPGWLTCHPNSAAEFMATTHWTWESARSLLPWREKSVTIGKKNQINNFCISAQGNENKCMSCHAGYGGRMIRSTSATRSTSTARVCHATVPLYGKGD